MENLRDIAVPDPPVGRWVGLVLGLVAALGLVLLLLAPSAPDQRATSAEACAYGDRICELAVAATEVWATR